YARVATPYCPNCGHIIQQQTSQQMVDYLLSSFPGSKLEIYAPIVRGKKGEFRSLLEDLRRQGFIRARIDGKIYDLSEEIPLGRYEQHSIEVLVDRLTLNEGIQMRLNDSLEAALKLAQGIVLISIEGKEQILSEKYSCPECGASIAEVTPRLFSFNSPYGACPTCDGLGVKKVIDPEKVIVDKNLSLAEGAIEVWESDHYYQMLKNLVEEFGYTTHTPLSQMDPSVVEMILYGTKEKKVTFKYSDTLGREHVYRMPFEGIIPNLERRYQQTESETVREEIESFMTSIPCPSCHGKRLKKEALSFYIKGLNISDLTALTIQEAFQFFEKLELSSKEEIIAHQILKEIRSRLRFLLDVGLSYLTLDRAAETLAGGEAQRLRLATQVGSGLVGVLYVLDEPSIGLHARDNFK
ncbi:MAG: excinuclease ABC subunit UvrA, partial [bacterium]